MNAEQPAPEQLDEQEGAAAVLDERAGQAVDTLPLAAFLNPVIPEALPHDPAQEAGEGWNAIDRLSPWQCFLSTYNPVEEVPMQHKHIWAWAWGTVLERIINALNDVDRDRALKWFLFLSQALLRSPGESGEEGRGIVAARFNCLAERQWGKLLALWEADLTQGRARQRREPGTEEEERDKLRRKVLALLGVGNVSKAVALITSNGVANLDDPHTRAQLEAKHPPRGSQIQASVMKDTPVQHLRGLRAALISLKSKKGSSPGAGGCRAEFLVALAETMDADKMQHLEEFGLMYLRSDLPPWFYQVLLSTRMVGLYKDIQQEGVRPLGIRHPLVRTFHRLTISSNRQELISFLEPQQLALSLGGCNKLYFGVRLLLEARPDFVCVKLYCKNAFSACSRARAVKVF